MKVHLLPVLLAIGLFASMCGCSGSTGRITLPSYNAGRISAAAITALDTNGDGLLDDKELASAPGFKAALARIDSNNDGRLSAGEIQARIYEYQKAGVGMRNETYLFTINGAPLANADVVFTPEPFFADVIESGTGSTRENGSLVPRIEGQPLPGLACGMYRVSVSKKDRSGKELLPSKYNTETVLGYEFPPAEFSSDKDRSFVLATR